MTIYTTAKSQSFGNIIGQGSARNLVTDIVSVAMTTAMIDNANDEVELLWLPKGAVVCDATISATDMDTGGSPALAIDVGDDSDEDRIFAASTVGQAGTLSKAIARTCHGYKYTATTKIKAYIQTAAATAAAGTLTFSVSYFVDPEFSATNAVVS